MPQYKFGTTRKNRWRNSEIGTADQRVGVREESGLSETTGPQDQIVKLRIVR
jgi:hypothetical protein